MVGSAGLLLQLNQNAKLATEISQLKQESQGISRLKSENEQLARSAAEAERLRGDEAEIAQLQTEAAALAQRLKIAAHPLAAKSSPATGITGPVYEVGNLDRQPKATFQVDPPTFPPELCARLASPARR